MREIEIPVAFPDRRQIVVKMPSAGPTSNILGLKRAIAKAEAVDVLDAGANADLLGKRFTAPAAFRLILRGMELSNDGSLEYYHLTTKGRNQQAIRVCPKHESLVNDDEVLEEDFSVPATVKHLEEEAAARLKEEQDAKAAAKARQATFHQKRRGGTNNTSARAGSTSRASSTQNSPSRQGKPQRDGSGGGHPAAGAAAASAAVSRPASSLAMGPNRSSGATPEPQMPAAYATGYPGRVALPPMPTDLLSAPYPMQQQHMQQQQHGNLNASLASNSSVAHYQPLPRYPTMAGGGCGHAHTVPGNNSPTRGLAPLPTTAAAVFAMPLDDVHGLIQPDGNVSPDILSKMRTYLRAAEKGEAPLPQVLPLPSAAGGHFTPPRGGFLSALPTNGGALLNQSGAGAVLSPRTKSNSNGNAGGGNCPGGSSCPNEQRLAEALQRIRQLEGAVESYKQLLHRLARMQDSENAASQQ